MRRREVVAGLLGAAGWSPELGAQQAVRGHRSARVGILNYAGSHYARVDDSVVRFMASAMSKAGT